VITGGRPALTVRKTARLLPDLHGVTADPVWVIRDDEAPGYQPDGHEVVTYERGWAEQWSADHWFDVLPRPAGFTGIHPAREWACQEAERRGCWAVLMLDDNIKLLSVFAGYGHAIRVAERHGRLALFTDLLAAVTLSTNSAFTGGQLQAVNPLEEAHIFARTGFPYSIYVEQTGPGREPWLGPWEDDILHAFQYGAEGTDATAAVVVPLRYQKDHQVSGGNHAWYDGRRAAGLQRVVPHGARITAQKSFANGRGGGRVYHTMTPDAIRTPLAVTDPGLFRAARDFTAGLAAEVAEEARWDLRVRVDRHAARAAARGT
jgi:hypothetical protein